MKEVLYSALWFTLIVVCEVVKWRCAGQLVKLFPWIR